MKTVDQKIQALAMADPMIILDMYCKNIDDSLKKDVIKLSRITWKFQQPF